ncbi:MAG: NAD(P)H-dependent oxidoreductase [Bacteroidota bacterium]
MIVVISGTNNSQTKSKIFASYLHESLQKKTDVAVKLLALDEIKHDYFYPDMYQQQASSITDLQDEFILPATKFMIVSPEYNGGMTGALKLFIDACSVRHYQTSFRGKKVALVGTATGRAGNLRGMDQLSQIMNHVGAIVMPNKLPISSLNTLINGENELISKSTIKLLDQHVADLIAF